MYGFPEDRPAAAVRNRTAPSDLAREMRSIADECHVMGLATNVPGWNTLARGFLRCAAAFESSGSSNRPTSSPDRHAA